jgi:hypothetical protein
LGDRDQTIHPHYAKATGSSLVQADQYDNLRVVLKVVRAEDQDTGLEKAFDLALGWLHADLAHS